MLATSIYENEKKKPSFPFLSILFSPHLTHETNSIYYYLLYRPYLFRSFDSYSNITIVIKKTKLRLIIYAFGKLYIYSIHLLLLIKTFYPWLVWLSGMSAGLRTKGSLVQFPVRAHAWVAGQVLRGHGRDNHTLMLLSLSFSLLLPL